MRVKLVACSLALAILLVSTSMASAMFAFPAIRPVYGADSVDMANVLGLMGDIVDFTHRELAGHATNASEANLTDHSELSSPVTVIPGPADFMSAIAPPIPSDTVARDNIYKTLVGRNLIYSSIAGKPMSYTITADSIKSIDSWVYKNAPAWKVRVGEGLAWDLIMDSTGTKILETKQLFVT